VLFFTSNLVDIITTKLMPYDAIITGVAFNNRASGKELTIAVSGFISEPNAFLSILANISALHGTVDIFLRFYEVAQALPSLKANKI